VAITVAGYLAGWFELSITGRAASMRGSVTGIHRPHADLAAATSTIQAPEENLSAE
jgi:hypothetical protein